MIIAMPNNQVVHRSDPKHAELTFRCSRRNCARRSCRSSRRSYSVQATTARAGDRGAVDGRTHAQLVGFKCLDLFASFGILSAGDPESEKSMPEFLNDPQINTKVDYLFVGPRHAREPADEPQRRVPPDPREARRQARLLHRRQRRPRLGDVEGSPARAAAAEPVSETVARIVGPAVRSVHGRRPHVVHRRIHMCEFAPRLFR